MADLKTHNVVYVDGFGKEHDALVSAVNVRTPGYVSLCYIDANAPEAENVRHLWDVPHRLIAPQETNPTLPQYDVNCWKEMHEPHAKLPEDHPAFDHPFQAAEKTETGESLQRPRPKYAAAIHDHAATVRAMAAGTPVEADSPEAKVAQQGFAAGAAQQFTTEEQQLAEELERELNAPEVPLPGVNLGGPSDADLDAAAAEQAAKDATLPVQSQTPDYKDLRTQLNDFDSTFYGPHGCQGCGKTIVRRAIEQGGQSYEERDPNLGPPRYQEHACTQAKEADVTEHLQKAADAGPAPTEPEPPSEDTKPFND